MLYNNHRRGKADTCRNYFSCNDDKLLDSLVGFRWKLRIFYTCHLTSSVRWIQMLATYQERFKNLKHVKKKILAAAYCKLLSLQLMWGSSIIHAADLICHIKIALINKLSAVQGSRQGFFRSGDVWIEGSSFIYQSFSPLLGSFEFSQCIMSTYKEHLLGLNSTVFLLSPCNVYLYSKISSSDFSL